MKPARSEQGYSLLELLLYVAMIGTLMVSLTYFFVTAGEARAKNQTISEVEQQGIQAMDIITQTIRNATSISSPATGTGPAATSLTLVVPTGSLSPTVFNLSGTTLQMTEGAGAAVPLTNSKVQVTSLAVRNLTRTGTSGVAQVSFTLRRTNTQNRNEYNYQKTFTSSAEIAW